MAYWVQNDNYTTETRISADLVYNNTGGSRRIYVYLDGELYNSNKYDVEAYNSTYGADSLRYNFTGLDPGSCYEIEAIFEGSESYPATDYFCTVDNSFVDPYVRSFGASEGSYNANTGILTFDMAVRIINDNDYSTSGTVQINIDGELFSWSGTIPSGSNVVTRALTVEVNVGKLSVGTYTDYQVDFSYNFYWINTDTGKTDGYNDSEFIYVDFTVSNIYEDFFWADNSTTINPKDTFTDKITASTWLDLISKVSKLTGSNISTQDVSTGKKFTATHYNNVASALNLPTVSSGEDCTADLFNALRTAYYEQAGLS